DECADSFRPPLPDAEHSFPRRFTTPTMNAPARIRMRVAATLLAVGLAVAALAPARADDLKDGRAALAAGKLDAAAASFEKAASQGYAEGRTGVGQVYLRRRNYAK